MAGTRDAGMVIRRAPWLVRQYGGDCASCQAHSDTQGAHIAYQAIFSTECFEGGSGKERGLALSTAS